MYHKTKPYSYPVSFNHVLQFDSDIEEPEYYAEFSDTLISASESDTISIYFNTDGGSAQTMIQLINLMRNCKAQIDGYLVGSASSAGSFLLLHCDNIYIGEYTEMLIHTVSFGSRGDLPSVQAHVNHVGKQAERLLCETYKHFLTEEELHDVLVNNRQLWLDDAEINRRLALRQEAFEKEHKDNVDKQYAEMEQMFEDELLPEWVLNKMTKSQLVQFIQGSIDLDFDEESKSVKIIPIDIGNKE